MKKSNVSLHSARLQKSWSREFVSQQVGVSLNTYIRWEMGQQTPRLASLQALCEVFAMSPEELGFYESFDAKADGTLERTSPQHSPLPLPPESSSGKIQQTVESWAESIAVCWKVYTQGAQTEIEKQLPNYFSHLKAHALTTHPSQIIACHILAEAYQLQALLKFNKGDLSAAHESCLQALTYSQLANDWNIYIASLLHMGKIAHHHKQPKTALQIYQEALHRIHNATQSISPLLKSWTFAGIGSIYAALGSAKEAIQYLQLAIATFPERPEQDLAFSYTRIDTSMLLHYEGLILLHLGYPQLAWNVLMQVDLLRPAPSRRMRVEILQQKASIAVIQNKLMQSRIYVEAAVKAAREIRSTFFISENFALYERMLALWGQDARVRILARFFF